MVHYKMLCNNDDACFTTTLKCKPPLCSYQNCQENSSNFKIDLCKTARKILDKCHSGFLLNLSIGKLFETSVAATFNAKQSNSLMSSAKWSRK